MTANKKIFALNIKWSFISQITVLASGILFNIIVSKYLGVTQFGIFSLTLTIYTIAVMIGSFGIPTAVTRYAASFKDNEDKFDIFISSCIINSIILGVIIGFVLYIIAGTIANIFSMPDLNDLTRIISVLIPFTVVNNTIIGLIGGLKKFKIY